MNIRKPGGGVGPPTTRILIEAARQCIADGHCLNIPCFGCFLFTILGHSGPDCNGIHRRTFTNKKAMSKTEIDKLQKYLDSFTPEELMELFL